MSGSRRQGDERVDAAARAARVLADRRLRMRHREVGQTLTQVQRRLRIANDDVSRRVFGP